MRTACAFVLGGMSVAIRFTSLAAFIPVGILLADQKPTNLQRIKFLLVPCALYGLVGITLSLTVDRLLYGFWTAPFLGSLHFNVIQGERGCYERLFRMQYRNPHNVCCIGRTWISVRNSSSPLVFFSRNSSNLRHYASVCSLRQFYIMEWTAIAFWSKYMDHHLLLYNVAFVICTQRVSVLVANTAVVLRTSRSCHLQQNDDDSQISRGYDTAIYSAQSCGGSLPGNLSPRCSHSNQSTDPAIALYRKQHRYQQENKYSLPHGLPFYTSIQSLAHPFYSRGCMDFGLLSRL